MTFFQTCRISFQSFNNFLQCQFSGSMSDTTSHLNEESCDNTVIIRWQRWHLMGQFHVILAPETFSDADWGRWLVELAEHLHTFRAHIAYVTLQQNPVKLISFIRRVVWLRSQIQPSYGHRAKCCWLLESSVEEFWPYTGDIEQGKQKCRVNPIAVSSPCEKPYPCTTQLLQSALRLPY